MTEHYVKLAIVRPKNGVRLHAQGGLSYTRMHELPLEKLAQVGLDPKSYRFHSLRSGGATVAAQNACRSPRQTLKPEWSLDSEARMPRTVM